MPPLSLALAQRASACSRVSSLQARRGARGASSTRRGVTCVAAFHQGPGSRVVNGVTKLGTVRVQQAVDGEWVILSDELRRRSAAARGVGGKRGGIVLVFGRSFG